MLHIFHSCFALFLLCLLPLSTGSAVRRSWETPTDEPEAQRRHQPSSSVTPSVFPSVTQSLNGYSCQSSWTAAYLLIPLYPALPSLSPSPCLPPQRPQTPLTRTPTGPWGSCASSPPRLQSSRLQWRRESRSFPKTPHTSALKFALARLSRQPPEACRPNRCLCWCPSLTFSHDPQQLNSGPARWEWVWNAYLYRNLSQQIKIHVSFDCKSYLQHPPKAMLVLAFSNVWLRQ